VKPFMFSFKIRNPSEYDLEFERQEHAHHQSYREAIYVLI